MLQLNQSQANPRHHQTVRLAGGLASWCMYVCSGSHNEAEFLDADVVPRSET
jgi:hypothetical protein